MSPLLELKLMLNQLTINYPKSFPDAVGITKEQFEQEANKTALFESFSNIQDF